LSGDGGGDSGITIINKDVDIEKIYGECTKHGIKPLKFNIYQGQ
ncbi:phosphomevalonate kinase, partial [Staphylococcus aureus]